MNVTTTHQQSKSENLDVSWIPPSLSPLDEIDHEDLSILFPKYVFLVQSLLLTAVTTDLV